MERDKAIRDFVREAGVTGAGGAGFPTHVKISAGAEVVIANGAECEPLTHVDQELMINYAPEIVAGLRLVMKSTWLFTAARLCCVPPCSTNLVPSLARLGICET